MNFHQGTFLLFTAFHWLSTHNAAQRAQVMGPNGCDVADFAANQGPNNPVTCAVCAIFLAGALSSSLTSEKELHIFTHGMTYIFQKLIARDVPVNAEVKLEQLHSRCNDEVGSKVFNDLRRLSGSSEL